jgi:hypothetical protein
MITEKANSTDSTRIQSVAEKSFARFAFFARLIANYFGSFAARTSIFSMTGGLAKSSGALLPSGVRFQRPERGCDEPHGGRAGSFSIDSPNVGAMGFHECGNAGLQTNRTHGRLRFVRVRPGDEWQLVVHAKNDVGLRKIILGKGQSGNFSGDIFPK